MKLKFTLALLLLTTLSFAQLSVKSRGRVFDATGKQLSPKEVRFTLSTKPQFLDMYDAGRNKKSAGNVLLIGGAACFLGDLAMGFSQDKQYPGALTFVGVAAMIIAIPVKAGYSKKIRKAIEGYNTTPVSTASNNMDYDLALCANQNGVGLQLKF